MPYLLVAVMALTLGLALGWYLRRKERWCTACGGRLACRGCAAGHSNGVTQRSHGTGVAACDPS